jgi:hypothetical protein
MWHFVAVNLRKAMEDLQPGFTTTPSELTAIPEPNPTRSELSHHQTLGLIKEICESDGA